MATKTKVRAPVYARWTTTVVLEHGRQVRLNQGEAWHPDDPTVRQHPEAFSEYRLVRTINGMQALD